MCTDRDKLIERIKKLLSVTENRGATENEAIAAALAAQRLIAQNDVEQWEISDDAEKIVSVTEKQRYRWQASLGVVIADNFRCRAYRILKCTPSKARRVGHICFVGYDSDANAAALVFRRLADFAQRNAASWAKTRVLELRAQGYTPDRSLVYNTFIGGFIHGVHDELEKQSQALLLVRPKAVDDAYDDIVRNFNSKYSAGFRVSGNDTESYSAGRDAGRDAVRSSRLNQPSADLLPA